MKEVIITKYGPPDVLQIREKRDPNPGPGQALIRNQFTGVNFSEIMARMRLYPGAPKPPATLGSEACGIVESVGNNVSRVKPGDRVMIFCQYKSYATHIVTEESLVMPLPENFSFEEGAAFPLVYVTAHMMMFDLGNLRDGDSILIHGAGGGVGTAAIQLAKTVDCKIIGTASKWKHGRLSEMGVHHCIDYSAEDVYQKVKEFTGNRGVELIIDPVGAKNWKISYRCLAKMGKLIIFGDQNLVKGKSFSFFTSLKELFSMPKFRPIDLMSRNKSVMGYHLGRMAGAEDKVQRTVMALNRLAEDGKLKPVIDKIFPFTNAAHAHEYIQERKNFGKVLIDFRNEN